MRTLILYSSIDGQTFKICDRLKGILLDKGHSVDLISIDNAIKDLSQYSLLVIASSIRYGKHNQKLIHYINAHTHVLNERKTAFVSVNLVARKAGRDQAQNNPYVQKFLGSIAWTPTVIGVFAGKLDYKKYSLLDRLMIQAKMLITKGPTNPKTEIEYTNWDQVADFGKVLAEL